MERVILDTGVLIGAARGRLDLAAVAEEDDVALAAVVVAEYLAGVLLDDDPGRAAAQRAFLDDVLSVVPLLDYDRDVAERHAALLAYVRRNGGPRGAHDLILAATAAARDRTLLTTDERARFHELPDVKVRLVRA